ncbi:glycosyltransferase family 2 protein [Aliarcobacter butzleri]|uniref:glycosyltransferase family 2 protein n=1 Tax=Aliarcobacter butzleri TaxID=28197 RepID=UPI003AE9E16E
MKRSVCIATYNGEKYIKEQLGSILSQIGENDEVIISDDSSTDNTVETIKSFNDNRIKIFKNTKEKGYTRNFENALEKASGDIIFLSDQDDVWVENKVQKMTEILKEYDFVVSDNSIVNENLEIINKSHFEVYKTSKGFLTNLLLPRYVGACMAFKKNVLQKSLPFPNNAKLSAHDYWISLIAEMYFKCYKLDEQLLLYRRHGANASSGGEKSKNSLGHKLKVRIYTLTHLLKRLYK